MTLFDNLLRRAKSDPRHIVLAEGGDPRVLESAVKAMKAGIARITLLGDEKQIQEQLKGFGLSDPVPDIIDPSLSPLLEDFALAFETLRKNKGMDFDKARRTMENPLYFAAMMVRQGLADGSIGGAVATTADTVRSAIQVIGLDPRYRLVSSYFLMLLEEPHHRDFDNVMVFADCALVVDPDSEALAEIAIASADSAKSLIDLEPRIGMLSFSTSSSADHPLVSKVIDGTELARRKRPDLIIEGDVQLDAALVPEISARKVKNSAVQGRANVLIFPGLESANIGYKMAERLGKAKAIGPILQGLARPSNDLSRGCSADDVFRLIAITSIQAQR